MKSNTEGTILKFNGAKTTIATAMTPAQQAMFEIGEALGYTSVESDIAWRDALKLCKAPTDRKILRAGFISAYRAVSAGTSEKTAQNRFDYLARVYTPTTSRKAKSVAAKKGRKEKSATGVAEQVNASAIAQRLAAVLHYVAAAQAKHMGDGDMLEVLGEIAAIAGGKTK